MNIIPKSLGAILILGVLAGCAGDDGAMPPSSTPPSPGQSPTTSSAPSNVKIENSEAKPGGGKMAALKPPAGDAKADDTLKVEGPGKADASTPAGAAAKLTADDLAGIKELPKAEQDVAIAQAVCPVSDHNLGSMGKPLKITAEGRTFYLCCDSCEEKVKKDAKTVIAKLDKQKSGNK